MVCSPKLVKRYKELKAEAPGCLLLMQVGSFMQVQDEDARAVSEVIGTLPDSGNHLVTVTVTPVAGE